MIKQCNTAKADEELFGLEVLIAGVVLVVVADAFVVDPVDTPGKPLLAITDL